MNELSLTIIRVAFLAVLWLFVIAAIGVVRTDLLGGPSTTARRGKARQAQAPRQNRPARCLGVGAARLWRCRVSAAARTFRWTCVLSPQRTGIWKLPSRKGSSAKIYFTG